MNVLDDLVTTLWPSAGDAAIRELLPRDIASLRDFYPRLQRYVSNGTRECHGTIDPQAIVRGEIVSMGAGSVIEAGAIIHESCRLILGPRSRIRAGAVLRDEVVIGSDCLIGANCDITRSVLLGPETAFGHSVIFNDSIAGAGVMLSAYVGLANTHLKKGKEISIRTPAGAVPTGRTYLGSLIGDGVRVGPNVNFSPGTIVLPNLELPPGSSLLGIIDAAHRERLMRDFFERWDPRP